MAKQDLFKGTAKYYSQYRRPYPKKLFEWIILRSHPGEKKGRYLDLGCGTGELTLPFSKYFREVVAVDVDREMLREGKRKARQLGTKNILWLNSATENLTAELGKFDLITIGSAFHWMDQKRVLGKTRKLLGDNGWLAIIGGNIWWSDKEKWKKKIFEVIKKYLGERRRAGAGYYEPPKKLFEELLAGAGFEKVLRREFPIKHAWTIAAIIGLMYSTSFASKRLFGREAEQFESDLARSLLALNPKRRFIDKHRFYVLLAHK